MTIEILKPLFDKMCQGVQCSQITEGYVDKTFFYQNKELVITGSISSGKDGYISIWGHYVVDIALYKGNLEPLNRNDHWTEVTKKNRERGYIGQITKYGKRTIVFIEETLIFIPISSGIQLELF